MPRCRERFHAITLNHARTVRRLQVSGTGWIPPSPFVQFKLYQGEVFQYKPGTRDWVESTQSETPESALRSERGLECAQAMIEMRAGALVCFNCQC